MDIRWCGHVMWVWSHDVGVVILSGLGMKMKQGGREGRREGGSKGGGEGGRKGGREGGKDCGREEGKEGGMREEREVREWEEMQGGRKGSGRGMQRTGAKLAVLEGHAGARLMW